MSGILRRACGLACICCWLFFATTTPTRAQTTRTESPVYTETFVLGDPSAVDLTSTTSIELGPRSELSPFNGLQFTWDVVGEASSVALEYAKLSAGRWSEYSAVTAVEEFRIPDAPPGQHTSTIYSFDHAAESWRLRITPTGKAIGQVTTVRVTSMDTRTPLDAPVFLPAADSPLAAGAKPAIVARTTWGDAAVKSWDANGLAGATTNATWMPTDAEIAPPTHLIIHHTATPNDGPSSDWPARVRQIWGYHTITNDWGDIGYHYLIDPNGVIYEGRFNGVRSDGTVIDGAHDYGFNRGTIGISMLGTFDSVEPSPSAQTALDNLVAYLMTTYRITPDTTAYYARQNVTLNTIIGHRDAQVAGHSTGCPGELLHDLLPGIRTKARTNVGTAPAQTWVSGVQVVDADVYVGDPVTFRVSVRNAYPDVPISGSAFTFPVSDTNYVYEQHECWAKKSPAGIPLFPKASTSSNRSNRFRIMAGVSGWDATYANSTTACATASTEDHPWRWSIGVSPLLPGTSRVVSGSVRFRVAGTYTVTFGLMKDWIGYPDRPCAVKPAYAACGLFAKTITVRTRQTPTATRPAALNTQIAQSTATARASTAVVATAHAQMTHTALSGELTATAQVDAGGPTYTPSATEGPTSTATAIPIQQTALRLAAATQTMRVHLTQLPTIGMGTLTATATRTRTPTRTIASVPFLRAVTLRTQKAVQPITTMAVVGSYIAVLESSIPARVALYDASTLTRIHATTLRGTSGVVLAVDDRTGDTVYVAGNYTAQYLYVQRFRLVGGMLRETGYWLTQQTAVPTKILANGTALTLALHDTTRNTNSLLRIDTTNLLYEETARVVMPGTVSSIINSDGVSGHIVVAGTLPSNAGYLLPVTYDPDGTVRTGTRLSLSKPLSTLCNRWRFVGAIPYALVIGADETADVQRFRPRR